MELGLFTPVSLISLYNTSVITIIIYSPHWFLSIHPIPLLLLIIVHHRLLSPRRLPLPLPLAEIRPVKRTGPAQAQPRPDTLEIEQMRRVAGELHDERVLVFEKGVVADGTDLVLG